MHRSIRIVAGLLLAGVASAGAQPLAPPSTPREPDAIEIGNGRVSIPLGQPLSVVLDALAAATGLQIELDPALAAERSTAEVREAPIDRALGVLLAGYDVFTFSEAGGASGHRAGAIWVMPSGTGRWQRPRSHADWESAPELLTRLDDPEPAVRAAALTALAERGGRLTAEAIPRALVDADEQVRARALDLAHEHGVAIEAAQLRILALSDPSASIRLQALLALESRHEAAEVAAAARTDPDPLIRQEAAALIARIERGERGR